MKHEVLYLGDTALNQAAAYLAGIMTHYGIAFDYLPSDHQFDPDLLSRDYKAIVISDYLAANFTPVDLATLSNVVRGGTGLVMIGGWESFSGQNCEYTNTTLKDVLPVEMQMCDDRINCPQPCLVEIVTPHEILADLPFDSIAPTIGGYNRVVSKPSAQLILAARRYQPRMVMGASKTGNRQSATGNFYEFVPLANPDPLLVLGAFGKGRVLAYMSDVAPHWVGGLVDWGDARVTACAPGSCPIEVGNWYATFFSNCLRWTM
jgi:uncharacterized membrane protein